MTAHDVEVKLVRTVAALLVVVVGVPLLFVSTLLVFIASLLWPSRLIHRWAAMLKESNPKLP